MFVAISQDWLLASRLRHTMQWHSLAGTTAPLELRLPDRLGVMPCNPPHKSTALFTRVGTGSATRMRPPVADAFA